MALFDRVSGQDPEDIKISPHFLYGLLRELARGEVNKNYVVSALALDANDETDLDWLIAQYQGQTAGLAQEVWLQGFWGILLLSESQYTGYDTQANIVAKITSL